MRAEIAVVLPERGQKKVRVDFFASPPRGSGRPPRGRGERIIQTSGLKVDTAEQAEEKGLEARRACEVLGIPVEVRGLPEPVIA